jgi:threonine/homoserine efflux transporter RhtA
VIVLSQHLTGVLLLALVMVVTASVGTTVTGRAPVGSANDQPQLSA